MFRWWNAKLTEVRVNWGHCSEIPSWMRAENLQDQKNKSSSWNSTRSDLRWPVWMRTFTDDWRKCCSFTQSGLLEVQFTEVKVEKKMASVSGPSLPGGMWEDVIGERSHYSAGLDKALSGRMAGWQSHTATPQFPMTKRKKSTVVGRLKWWSDTVTGRDGWRFHCHHGRNGVFLSRTFGTGHLCGHFNGWLNVGNY